MREHFLACGVDESGALTLEVFIQAMQSADVDISEAEHLFRCLDVDGDGEIAFSEFIAGASLPNNLAAGILHLAFNRFDVDGDGKITSKDLRAILGKSSFKRQNVEDWLLDVGDGDGAVSFEMFSAFMRQSHALPGEVNLARGVGNTIAQLCVFPPSPRSVSMTSLQSQDEHNSIQKVQGSSDSTMQSGGKVLLGDVAVQQEKSAHAHAAHSSLNESPVC